MKIPVPFVGWVEVDDLENLETMLREQLRMQQEEIMRLTIANQGAYQKGWSDAIDAATKRLRKGFDEYEND